METPLFACEILLKNGVCVCFIQRYKAITPRLSLKSRGVYIYMQVIDY